jgi:chloramphenicol-sensitive protein RarD
MKRGLLYGASTYGIWGLLPLYWRALRQRPSAVRCLGVAAMVVAFNWYLYIWGVNHGRVVETSLGYFISPLITVLFGVVLFRERLRRGQLVALGLAAVGAAWLVWLENAGRAGFGHAGWSTTLLLIAAGPATAIPLLFFAGAVTRIPLTYLGLLQYLTPTLQFALAVFAFGEPMPAARFTGFALIWTALAAFTASSRYHGFEQVLTSSSSPAVARG